MYHGYFMDHYARTIERRPFELKEERKKEQHCQFYQKKISNQTEQLNLHFDRNFGHFSGRTAIEVSKLTELVGFVGRD